ncbi:MAG: hypothetical protein IPL12_15780 [Bacteroidetes bacterium]|nr:hypothetical protein [Bacteroidota bacterium]
MLLGLPNLAIAQCYTACGGTCSAAPAISGYPDSWTSQHYCITDDLLIEGEFTIDGATCLEIAAGKEIVVKNGGNLTITGTAQLYSLSAL